MCTALKYRDCMGRNFDYEISYKEQIIKIKKGEYGKYSIIGVCTGAVTDYPLLYDGMNECGLCMGGLAFEGNAHYMSKNKFDALDNLEKCPIFPFQFILHILSNFQNVKEVKEHLKDIVMVDIPYSDDMPNSDLHWFVCDQQDSIIIEFTESGLGVYDGEIMTNNPPYPKQRELCKLFHQSIDDDKVYNIQALNNGIYRTRGANTYGLQGDYTSMGRFIRTSYLKKQLERVKDKFTAEEETFHLLSSAEQIYGVTEVQDKFEYTIYSVVYNMNKKTMMIKKYNDMFVKNFKVDDVNDRYDL